MCKQLINNIKKILVLLLPLFILVSCVETENFDVEVQIVNKSNIVFDSLRIHLYPNNDSSFYNVKPKDTIIKIFKYRNFTYPKGRRTASVVRAYKDYYYYVLTHNFIESPFVVLEREYKFYLWANGIQNKEGSPHQHHEKRKIE